jgi:hypothetical protein
MPYHPIDPFDAGLLSVADGNEIYWEISGNPNGKPAIPSPPPLSANYTAI